jgi:hypothetical protein
MANTNELAYLNDRSKIKYRVPKDLAYAANRVGQSKGAYHSTIDIPDHPISSSGSQSW